MNKVLNAILTSAFVFEFLPVVFSADEIAVEKEDIYSGIEVGTVPMKNKDNVIMHLEHRCKEVSDFTDRINTESKDMGQEKAIELYAHNYFGSAAGLVRELADVLEVQGKDVSDLRDLEKEMRKAYNTKDFQSDEDESHIQLQKETFAKIPPLIERAKEVIEELKS